jgi:hypothetical protein
VYKNSAIKRKHTWNLSISAAKYLFESDCYYCGTAPNQISAPRSGSGDPNYAPNVFIYNGIDRIDNTEGYIDGNVVTCCGMCNTMKRHYSIDEFLAKVRAIYERHCKTAAAN